MFREALEAGLVIGIILGYLTKTDQKRHNIIVYTGLVSGIAASVVGAVLFSILAGGFTGTSEQIFEGSTMIIGAVLLTTMIIWMMRQRHIASKLERKVSLELKETHRIGLFLLVFFAVLREGIEAVIFLSAASYVSADNSLIGALLGVIVAIVVVYLMVVGSRRIEIKRFFTVTSVLLILFAAGLVSQGMHELQEAGVLPTFVDHVWNINPPLNPDGSYPLLHENGYVGSIFKSLFGYSGAPSDFQVLSYVAYLILVYLMLRRVKESQVSTTVE
jgi:high-affinity iron transporter